jgi:hypothetical protein
MSSVLERPIVDSMRALSKASPTVPMEGAMPAREASVKLIAVYWANSSGRRNTSTRRWFDAMYKHEHQAAVREMRGKVWSPGWPSTARREHRVGFWSAIAGGLTSEEAAAEVGMSSAFGARSFREAGGMPPLRLVPVSGRYLSFEEREEIAILQALRIAVASLSPRTGCGWPATRPGQH